VIQRPTFRSDAGIGETLVQLSRYFGANPEFVLAGGGNTSAKEGGRILVKASGRELAGINEDGFVSMDRAALEALVEREMPSDAKRREEAFKEAILAARVEPQKNQRPSVECALHAIVDGRYVVHGHSTYANMITCAMNGESLARELFGDEVLWAPYVDPGWVLAKTIASMLREHSARTGKKQPAAVLMQNHGLIVSADTPDEVLARTDAVVEKIKRRMAGFRDPSPFGRVTRMDEGRRRVLIDVIAPALRALLSRDEGLKVVTFDDSETITALAGSEGEAARGGPLTPDQIAYCRAFPLWYEPGGDDAPKAIVEGLKRAVETHEADTGFAPVVVLVKGVGLFACGDDFAGADTAQAVYTDAIRVMAGAQRLGGVRYLEAREREFIEGWEVENYRRQVAAGARAAGRAAGKVALVTGAAQGFGYEIARDLAREGAHVVLVDINAAGVEGAAKSIAAECGAGRAAAIGADVTDGDSVSNAVHEAVRRYGGFDLFISNAGVLRAGSVREQPTEEFDFVTSVNYKGYFVCVKHAAPVMAVQRLAKPGYTSDIIQINSKSGLEGSNRNAAYAGSKFGGIGLTQSFALELIEDGIKVNAICPGNFFDGPLWSGPENGLFAQYLRSGKVPGARTVDDVRRAYEAKVPMGRGCTTSDVMKAVYYLVEQQYETGQALPVTGGQVMLS